MPRLRVNLGKWDKKEFVLPDYGGLMENLKGESLMFFGFNELNGRIYRPFFGLGIVRHISHGEERDIVYIDFGMQGMVKDHTPKAVYAYDNHAKRQILTLKRGQVCMVFGLCRFYTWKDKKTHQERIGVFMFAKGFQGWYVPTMKDVKKMPRNDDMIDFSDREKEVEEQIERDVLELFEKDLKEY